ncbi:MAG: hypothetical protein NTW14_01035 [bacterium]|nr:hypothetical protein [bacterium]
MNRYLIGIDGGGSHSRAILVDDQIKLIAQTEGKGLNPLTVGWEKFGQNITELLEPLRKTLQPPHELLIGAGLAGVGNEPVRQRTEAEIVSLSGASRVLVISDALAALWGAFQGGPGLLLIAGTGSICLGMNRQGQVERTGGFGRLLGDEGSGYWIAIKAIKAALRSADGRGGSERLRKLTCEEFGLNDIREIIPLANSGSLTPDRIAAFTEKILPLIREDETAKKIVSDAADFLAELVKSTTGKLNMDNAKLALWGGLWKSSGAELIQFFVPALKRRQTGMEICQPIEAPEWGTIRYLLRTTG